MSLALVKAAKTVGAQGLQDANVNVGIKVLHECRAIQLDETGKPVEIVIEELLAEFGGQVGLGIVQERSDVILQSAFAAALVIHKKGIAVAQHDVAGLEVAVEKVIARGGQEEFGQAAEIVFQGLLIEGDAGEAEEIILEIVQVPGDGLAIETGAGITHFVIQITAGFDLEAGEDGDGFAVGFDHLGSDIPASTVFREEFEKRGVAEVFLEISAVAQVFGVNFRHRQAVAAKMLGKFEKGDVLFSDGVQDADGGDVFVGETDDLAAGTAELALEQIGRASCRERV